MNIEENSSPSAQNLAQMENIVEESEFQDLSQDFDSDSPENREENREYSNRKKKKKKNPMNVVEVISPEEEGRIYGVTLSNKRGIFTVRNQDLEILSGDQVILKTNRGRELATVRYLDLNQEINRNKELGIFKILRVVNEQDLKVIEQNREKEDRSFQVADKKIRALKLNMRVVRTECLFDGSRTMFYFLAPQKVDFRELVKVLSSELRTRIELRQISTREYVGIQGAVGSCGRATCCSTFLIKTPVVSLGMVENQRLIKNPTKLNGICGRLKCCLTYENNFYREALEGIPPRSACIGCSSGKKGVVCGANVFKRTLTVRMEDDFSYQEIPFEEAKKCKQVQKPSRQRDDYDSDEGLFEDSEEK